MAGTDRRRERGVTTITTILLMGLTLVFFVSLTQLIVWQYGRGSVRAALDEATRAGAGTRGGLDACEQHAAEVLDDLLGGSMGDEITVRCTDTGDALSAEATVIFRAWLPPTPDWVFTVRASAPFEPATVGADP